MLTKLLYLLFFAVLALGVFRLFFEGRVGLGPTGICFDMTSGFYNCER